MPNNKLMKWKQARRHTVTLPSGTEVEIEIPNLPALIKSGQIPNSLLDAAAKAQTGTQTITPELIDQQAEFYNKLVAVTVKEPEVSEEDVPELPYEDVEMLVEFATRQIDTDAVGHHFAGLEKVPAFREFRGLDDRLPSLADL